MLDWLRKGASGWVAQLFIALLVLSFAVWGVSDIFTGFRSDTIATVGSTDIPVSAYQRQYDIAVRQLGQQLGQPVTADQAKMMGVPQQVLGRLISQATLADAARNLGLGISGQTLARQIADDPSFQGTTGTFDRNLFNQILQQTGQTEDQYISELRDNYVRQQIADGLAGGTKVPQAYMRAFHELQNEERKVSYVVLTPALAGTIGAPADADLTAYFDAHKADWRAPEFRALSVMQMLPADLARPDDVSDADARKIYDAQVAVRFTTPERRKVEQIVFKDRAEAEAAAASLTSGKTFEQLMAERQLKPEDVDLGLITEDKILDPTVREAAFKLAANTVSGVIDGGFGPAIVRVTIIEPEVVKTFEEVKGEIKTEIATETAIAEIADQHDVIEDARAGGDSLADIAGKYELKLVNVPPVDKAGNDANGNPVTVPGGNAVLAAAFDPNVDVGLPNHPLPVDRGFIWYDVTAIEPERDRQLSEVRAKVAEAWTRDQVEQKLTAKANEIRDRIAKGEDIAKVAGEASLAVKTAEKITRRTQPAGDLSAAAIAQIFVGPKGSAAVAAGSGEQSKIVLVVTDTAVPPYFAGAPELAQLDEQMSQQLANDILTQYIGELQSELGVSVNQAAWQLALGEPTS